MFSGFNYIFIALKSRTIALKSQPEFQLELIRDYMQKWRQWETANDVDLQLAIERQAVIRPLVPEGKLSHILQKRRLGLP